jgi:hypothetical protein
VEVEDQLLFFAVEEHVAAQMDGVHKHFAGSRNETQDGA